MRIEIAERLRPFCHLPGTYTVLPGCGFQVQIFPCLIRLYDLKQTHPVLLTELHLKLKGPIQQFTICNDLEKGRITVFGKTTEGWIRYHLMSSQQKENVRLDVDRAPLNGFFIYQEQKSYLLKEKESFTILDKHSLFTPYQLPFYDRLSLGNHKAQDWEMIKRRLNLAEIFPFWHRLGQFIPPLATFSSNEGTLALLEACRNSFRDQNPEKAQEHWLNLILGGFNSMLSPQLEDINYQGIINSESLKSSDLSSLVILKEGSDLIRRLFFQQEEERITILPYLLPCLPFGRLINVSLKGGGILSFEWTKKTIRRLAFFVEQEQEISFKFSHVRSYRLRENIKDKGTRRNCQEPLLVKKKIHYFFDNFN